MPRTLSSSNVDPIRVFRATSAPGGDVYEFMNRTRLDAGNALQRNAPRNSPLNEVHRERGSPNYALGFITDMYGNQNGTGFRVGNTVAHADIVENGRSASFKKQRFSWTQWGGQIRKVKATHGRAGTRYMARTVERITRQRAAG